MAKQEEEKKKSKTCFVVTPIGVAGSEIFVNAFGLIEAVIEPVLNAFDCECVVANTVSKSGSITDNIIKHLKDDDLVIANLTGLNPNVMYEVAVRHSFRKPIVLMAEDGTYLPFDLKDQRTIFYKNEFSGVNDARATLTNFINEALADNPKKISNPIYRAISDENIINDPEVEEPIKQIYKMVERLLVNSTPKTSSSSTDSFISFSHSVSVYSSNLIEIDDLLVNIMPKSHYNVIIRGDNRAEIRFKAISNGVFNDVIKSLKDREMKIGLVMRPASEA
jgi:hypothetical protein